MQQPKAFFVCGQCDAGYDSAGSLNAHKNNLIVELSDNDYALRMVHRERSPHLNPASGACPMMKLMTD